MTRLRFVSYLAGIVLLAGLSWLLFGQGNLFSVLMELNISDLLVLLLFSVGILVLLALQFRFMVWVFGIHLPAREWFGLTAVNSMFSYYLPARAGLFVRGAYLKKKYGFPVSDYTALVVATQLIALVVTGLMGFVLVYAFGAEAGNLQKLLLVLFAGITSGSLFVYLSVSRLVIFSGRLESLSDFMARVRAGFEVWQGHATGLAIFSAFNLGVIVLRAVRLQLCFHALGVSVGFAEVLIVQALLSVAFVVSITPGNLGVQEGLTVLCAGLMSVTADIALAASLVDRAVTVFVIISAGMVSARLLLPGGGVQSQGVAGG